MKNIDIKNLQFSGDNNNREIFAGGDLKAYLYNSTFESDVIMNINNNSIDINGSIYIYKYDYRNKCAITIEKDSKNDECSLISSKFVDEIIDKFNDKSHDINTLMERSITGLSSFVQKFYEDSIKNVCDYIDISDSDDITIFF